MLTILFLAACHIDAKTPAGRDSTRTATTTANTTPRELQSVTIAQDGIALDVVATFGTDFTGSAPAELQWDDGTTTATLDVVDGVAELEVQIPDPCAAVSLGEVGVVLVVEGRDAEATTTLDGTAVDTVATPFATVLPGLTVLCGGPVVDLYLPAGSYRFTTPGGSGMVLQADPDGYGAIGFTFSAFDYVDLDAGSYSFTVHTPDNVAAVEL